MGKSIHFAVYLHKLDEFELKELYDRKYIGNGAKRMVLKIMI